METSTFMSGLHVRLTLRLFTSHGAAKRAVEIMYFETPDVDLEYWTPRDTNITALCTAIGITGADYVAKVRLVMENKRTLPSHLRKQQQDARNKVHTMGRVMLYERFNIRIARPDRGREVVGTLSPAAFCAEHHPDANSWGLLKWHFNDDGLPFSTDFFTSAVFHSFQRPGHSFVVLRFKQLAFFLLGVEYKLINGEEMPRSPVDNRNAMTIQHSKVHNAVAFVVQNRTAATGPWWEADKAAWKFHATTERVFISCAGLPGLQGP
ncbi:unnamed protein product [Closterium sp. Yama58-4]|nr:unnamed protein product [Closterium sp. Yama58-4]